MQLATSLKTSAHKVINVSDKVWDRLKRQSHCCDLTSSNRGVRQVSGAADTKKYSVFLSSSVFLVRDVEYHDFQGSL